MLTLRHYLSPYKTIRTLLVLVATLNERIELQGKLHDIQKTLIDAYQARITALESINQSQKIVIDKINESMTEVERIGISRYVN
jgi:hypothetical protein